MVHSSARQQTKVAIAAGILAIAVFGKSQAASAGECPADKRGVNLTKAVTTPAKDVTDTVLTSINLAAEPAKIQDRELRLRKLVIEPGGVVPWHSHGDRPAIIYIIDISLRGRSLNTRARAQFPSFTRPATWPGRRTPLHTGGRTPATRRWCYSQQTFCATRWTRTCDRGSRHGVSLKAPAAPDEATDEHCQSHYCRGASFGRCAEDHRVDCARSPGRRGAWGVSGWGLPSASRSTNRT
jgi:hypothetical protein